MADNHVESGPKKKSSLIFNVFTDLLEGDKSSSKCCAVLLDVLKSGDLTVGSGTSTAYAAKRLVRGLASSDVKRQDIIFSTLTTAIERDVLSVTEVFKALDSETQSNNEQKFVGPTTVLTYISVLKSGKFTTLPETSQISILQKLLTTGLRKSYFKNAIAYVLTVYFGHLSKNVFKASVWPTIKEEMKGANNTVVENPFFVLLVAVAIKYPTLCSKVIATQFGTTDALFGAALSNGSYFSEALQDVLLKEIRNVCAASQAKICRLWKKIFEKDHKSSSKWNSYILKLGRMLLETFPDLSAIDYILIPDFISIILQVQPEFKKNTGNEDADNVRAILLQTVERLCNETADDELRVKIVKKLLFDSGELHFDAKTKTKTIQSILEKMSETGLKKLIADSISIIKGISKKKTGEEWTTKEKISVLILLQRLTTHSFMTKHAQWVVDNAKFIFSLAFLKTEIKTSIDLRKTAKEIFYKIIELRNFKIEDAVNVLSAIAKYVDEHVSELELEESALQHWKSVLSTDTKISKTHSEKEFISVRLLLLHMGLTLFRDRELAVSTIQELLQCYSRLKSERKSKRLKNVETEEPQWVEVTVDLLLAMLSRENKVLRHIVSAVFPSIATQITPTALQQIIDALDPTSRNDVLKHVDSDDSDEEMVESEDEEEESGEESAIDEDDGENETVNDKLRMAVRNALGYSAALTDDESVDMDDMNEEEEKRLNESLANAFRLFRSNKSSKKKQSRDEEALTHFRIRILDLVEIIITGNPSLASCLELLPPLFTLLVFAIKDQHQKPLQNRLETVLKKLGNVKKFADASFVTYPDLVVALDDLFKREVSGLVYVEMAPVITECCSLFIRASQVVTEEGDVTIEDTFISLMDRHFISNDRKVPFTAFKSILRQLWRGNWKLMNHIMKLLLNPDLKIFKKQKLVELLEVFYKNDRLHSTATDDQKTFACKVESKFAIKFSKLLDDYNTKRKDLKVLEVFYSKLLPVLTMAIFSRKKYRQNYGSPPEWGAVVQQLLQCKDLLVHQKTKLRLASLAESCDVPLPTPTENSKFEQEEAENTSENEDDEEKEESGAEKSETQGKRSKKKGRSNEAMKRKKEARELREAASAQGLETVSFGALSTNIPEGIELADPSPSKKRKTEKPTKKKNV